MDFLAMKERQLCRCFPDLAFKGWDQIQCSMKIFQKNRDGKFISVWLHLFCKWPGITIKYTSLYMYEENNLAKRG